jgi:hypothetical protein
MDDDGMLCGVWCGVWCVWCVVYVVCGVWCVAMMDGWMHKDDGWVQGSITMTARGTRHEDGKEYARYAAKHRDTLTWTRIRLRVCLHLMCVSCYVCAH